MFFPNNHNTKIVEYMQTGKAWDLDTLVETGKVYMPFEEKKK